MSRDRSLRASSHQTAVTVRLIAFVVAVASFVAIPGALVEATVGAVSLQSALSVIGCGIALILLAAWAARSVDPLKR